MTTKCDVYSFGVVALEAIMGRHPGELISILGKPSIQNIMLKDILDPRLPLPSVQKESWDVIIMLTVALACLRPMAKTRPSMRQVVQELLNSKPPFSMHFHDISIQQLTNQEIVDNRDTY